jgi:hypothetical protein
VSIGASKPAELSVTTFCTFLREFSPFFSGCPAIGSVSRSRDDGVMIATTRTLNRYDHRLREPVRSTGNLDHALRRGVPRSTARGWLSATRTDVVTLHVVEGDALTHQQEWVQLRRRVERLVALFRVLVVLLKVSGFSLAHNRIGEKTRKQALLHDNPTGHQGVAAHDYMPHIRRIGEDAEAARKKSKHGKPRRWVVSSPRNESCPGVCDL